MSDNQNNAASNGSASRAKAKADLRKKLIFWRVVAAVLLLAVLALGATLYYLYFEKDTPVIPPDEPTAEQVEEESAVYTAWCYTPLGDPLSVSGPAGEALELPQAPQIDGYTFLAWTDENGRRLEDGTVTLSADAAFSALYAVAFRDEGAEGKHEPYLFIGEDLCFHPSATVSRAEAAELLYASLDTDLTGSVGFVDVDSSASCWAATAALKDLGVIEGSRFHPDEAISLGELFEMLSRLFPYSTSRYDFSQIAETDSLYRAFCLAMDKGWISDADVSPDSELTRAQAAHIFNLLRGRAPVAETDCAKVGTLLDVSFRDPYFWDIAEAAIVHDARKTEAGEIWNSSEALPLREEGLFFIGTALHCIDADGSAVVNGSYGNFDFGSDGVITTGMPELDAYVQDTLKELVDPATMDPERMLYTIFNYVTYRHGYLGVHNYEIGDTSWVNDEAYYMFTVGKGNCYCFSSQFYVLAKAIGFDAVIYSGTIDPSSSPHAWVEIMIDGVPYIYDTELEYTQVTFSNKHSSYYKVPFWKAKGWHYFRGDEIEAEYAAKGYFD